MSKHQPSPEFDLQLAVSENRLVGLWRLITGYQWAYAGANASLAVAALAKTGIYLLLAFFVDNILGNDYDVAPLALIAAGFVVLAITEGTFTFFSGRLAAFTAENTARRLRNFLFDHIQRLSFTYHDKTQTGDLIQRVTSDVDALRRFFAEQAIGIGRIILLFVINFTAILSLNPYLAVLSILVVPLVFITSVYFFKRIGKAYEAYQEQDAILSTTLQENLSGVRVVKAFARQDYEKGKFEKYNWEKFIRGRRLLIMHSFF